jgi:hypothetical protein
MPKLFWSELFPFAKKSAEPMLLRESTAYCYLHDFQVGIPQQDFRPL